MDECPRTDNDGHCADHGKETERNMTTRQVGLWGLGIIIALLFSILNVSIPLFSKLSSIDARVASLESKVEAVDARVSRLSERLADHMEGGKK